jgi:hypothetical protein
MYYGVGRKSRGRNGDGVAEPGSGAGANQPVGFMTVFSNPMSTLPPHTPTADAYGFSEVFGNYALSIGSDGASLVTPPNYMRHVFPGAVGNTIIPGTGGNGTFVRSTGTWTPGAEVGKRYILTGSGLPTAWGVKVFVALVTSNDSTTLSFSGNATGATQAGSLGSSKDVTNTGNGTISGLSALSGVQLGNYRAVCTAAATNAGTFTVTDPLGNTLGTVTVGGAAFNNQISFTIADGTTDFIVGDGFTIRTGGWPGGADYINAYAAGTGFSAGSDKNQLYVRVIFRVDPTWTDNGNVQTKFFFFRQGNPTGNQAANHYISLTVGDAVKPGIRLQGAFGFATPSGPNHDAASAVAKNVWHDLEFLAIANTPGVYDGVGMLWLNGILVASGTDLGYFTTDNTPRFDALYFNPTYGGGTNPVPADQWLDIAHWYVAASTGTAATLTGVSRDTGSAAGGAVVTLTGTGFSGIPIVKFGTTYASAVTVINSTTLTCTVPAHTTGTVDVTVEGQTLSNAFTYLPAATTTFATSDFESGVLTPFTADLGGTGAVTVDTTYALSGTKSVKCAIPSGTSGIAQLLNDYNGNTNPALDEANGVYHRWYVLIPASTVTNVSGSGEQLKLHLCRVGGTQTAGTKGWVMPGVGNAFASSPSSEVVLVQDWGTSTVHHTTTPIPNAEWTEIQVWYKRSGGVGQAKVWLNGKLSYDTATDGGDPNLNTANLGNDDTTSIYKFQCGIPFAQMSGPVNVWVDNIKIANGYIDP